MGSITTFGLLSVQTTFKMQIYYPIITKGDYRKNKLLNY